MEKILNVPNAQRALVMIREQLNEINNTKPNFLDNIKFYYRMADKENKEGRRFFKLLNKTKDSLHSMRKEENSLILINKLLKKFIRENRGEFSLESSSSNNKNIINYLPTVYEFNKMREKDKVLVNKLFPTVSYKDIKRWFKNNPDKIYIELFEILSLSNGLTAITERITVYKDSLKGWKEYLEQYSFIFTADCFNTGNSEFIGIGHRKEYVQKCIDLYGSVICKFKNDSINTEEYLNRATEISGIENDHFQGVFFNWKYVEVTIENFR